MSGPELGFLYDPGSAAVATDERRYDIGHMTENDRYRGGRDRRCRAQHPLEHREPGHTMQDLGVSGPHSGTLARGENDDVEIRHAVFARPRGEFGPLGAYRL